MPHSFATPGKLYDFKDVLKSLKKRLPALLPVFVQFKSLSRHRCIGLTSINEKKKRIEICIDEDLDEDLAVVVLIHEWAHAISWDFSPKPVPDHGPEWGLAYSRAYRVLNAEKIPNGY